MDLRQNENTPICVAFAMGIEAEPFLKSLEVLRTWRKGKTRHWLALHNGTPLRVIRCGVGANRAKRAIHELGFIPDTLIVAGSAGALSKELDVGSIVIPEEIFNHSHPAPSFKCKPSLVSALGAACAGLGVEPCFEPMVTSAAPVFLTNERLKMYERTNCWSVDMESAAIAEAAGDIGADFACIRVISDGVAHSRLPGKPSTNGLVTSPWKLPGIISEAIHWTLFLRNFKKSLLRLPPILLRFINETGS
jgi:nucleoside phosphorylase